MHKANLIALLVLFTGCSSESPQNQFESLLGSEWSKVVNDNPVYASSMGDLSRNTEWSDTSVENIYSPLGLCILAQYLLEYRQLVYQICSMIKC